MRHRMRRRDLVRALLALAATPALLALGSGRATAQEQAPASGPPYRNNIIGLNVGRLHQRLYIWAAADLANANGGDWGYITSVWTIEDREERQAELNLQVFLDYCFEYDIHPIIRVATRYDARREVWNRPDWDEPVRWREYSERGRWPTERVWIVAGNEPNLGREWGGEVDPVSYAQYLSRFLDVFADSQRFKIVNGPLDISNTTELPKMQDALEFLDGMAAAAPKLFERLPAWASNPYQVPSGGGRMRYTHLAYEAELDRIGREMPVLITEAGHLETGDEQEIASFYARAYRDWMVDPKVIAATPLFWHPDRNDYWMFELDRKGAFVHTSPTYDLLRQIPKVAGSPSFVTPLVNVARVTTFETLVEAEAPPPPAPEPRRAPGLKADDYAWEAHASQPQPQPQVQARAPFSATPTSAERDSRVAAPGGPSMQVANTAGQGARLRAAPSRDADPIAMLDDGTPVQALGPAVNGDDLRWQRVRTEDGAEGWVAADLLAPPGSAPTAEE
jgi:Bacterial SH3 domain